jgi:hypothetical protein
MARTSAERQKAWRARRAEELRNARRSAAERPALDDRLKRLETELRRAQARIKTLSTVTRLDPAGVLAFWQGWRDELESASNADAPVVSGAVARNARRMQNCLLTWYYIKDGAELARRCRPLLGRLRIERRDRDRVAALTAQLRSTSIICLVLRPHRG